MFLTIRQFYDGLFSIGKYDQVSHNYQRNQPYLETWTRLFKPKHIAIELNIVFSNVCKIHAIFAIFCQKYFSCSEMQTSFLEVFHHSGKQTVNYKGFLPLREWQKKNMEVYPCTLRLAPSVRRELSPLQICKKFVRTSFLLFPEFEFSIGQGVPGFFHVYLQDLHICLCIMNSLKEYRGSYTSVHFI